MVLDCSNMLNSHLLSSTGNVKKKDVTLHLENDPDQNNFKATQIISVWIEYFSLHSRVISYLEMKGGKGAQTIRKVKKDGVVKEELRTFRHLSVRLGIACQEILSIWEYA